MISTPQTFSITSIILVQFFVTFKVEIEINLDSTTADLSILQIVVLLRGSLLHFKVPKSSSGMFKEMLGSKTFLCLQQIKVNFATYLLCFCQSTTICSIQGSVIETASVVPLRNKHNVRGVDFSTEILAVWYSYFWYIPHSMSKRDG